MTLQKLHHQVHLVNGFDDFIHPQAIPTVLRRQLLQHVDLAVQVLPYAVIHDECTFLVDFDGDLVTVAVERLVNTCEAALAEHFLQAVLTDV